MSHSHILSEAASNQVDHNCRSCGQVWPRPRTLKWPPKFSIDQELLKIKPSTPETIVVYQTWDKTGKAAIPSSVFENFSFTHDRTSKDLIRGVYYSPVDGKVDCEENFKHAQTGKTDLDANDLVKYLRVINLNTWYWSLAFSLLGTSFTMVDLQSSAWLCADLLFNEALEMIEYRIRLIFILVWCSSILVALFLAYRRAKVDWLMKTMHAKGDLISSCSERSVWKTILAMVLFEFLGIDQQVRDIVIALHPWKGVQEYSAFKCEGHRAFFVGFSNRTMYRVESSMGMYNSLPGRIMTKLIVFGFQIYLIYSQYTFEERHKLSYSLVFPAFISCFTLVSRTVRYVEIFRHRRLFKKRLLARLRQTELTSPQHCADQRLLTKHFRLKWDHAQRKSRRVSINYLQSGAWVKRSESAKELCRTCGRLEGGDVVRYESGDVVRNLSDEINSPPKPANMGKSSSLESKFSARSSEGETSFVLLEQGGASVSVDVMETVKFRPGVSSSDLSSAELCRETNRLRDATLPREKAPPSTSVPSELPLLPTTPSVLVLDRPSGGDEKVSLLLQVPPDRYLQDASKIPDRNSSSTDSTAFASAQLNSSTDSIAFHSAQSSVNSSVNIARHDSGDRAETNAFQYK